MKNNRILLLIFLAVEINTAFAQNPAFSSGQTHYANVQVFRLKAWTFMSKKEWRDVIYRFPEFKEARITLSEGFSPSHVSQMNYSNYDEAIEVINEKGDTTMLDKTSQLKSVTIGGQVFYNNYPFGYVEKLNQTSVALGAKHVLKMMFESNNGEVFTATDWHMPTTRLDRLYIKQDEYYFIDQKEELHKATMPSILKIYSSSKKEVKKYVRQVKVDFKNKEDLVALLEFCDHYHSQSPSRKE